jgi:hypothetical protein
LLPDGSIRIATLVTRGNPEAAPTVRFSSDTSAVTYEHRGPPATYELHVSAMNRKGRMHTFASGLQVATDGQTATFTPADWHDLGRITLAQGGMTAIRVLSGQPKSIGGGPKRGRAKGKASKKADRSASSQKEGRRGQRASKKEVSAERAAAQKKKSKKKNKPKGKG